MAEAIKLTNALEKMMNLLASAGEERRANTIKKLYNRSKYADTKELSVIGREVIRLFQGGMGSFFNDLVLQSKGKALENENIELDTLENELFNAALEVIK
jgi:hypothetical protein